MQHREPGTGETHHQDHHRQQRTTGSQTPGRPEHGTDEGEEEGFDDEHHLAVETAHVIMHRQLLGDIGEPADVATVTNHDREGQDAQST